MPNYDFGAHLCNARWKSLGGTWRLSEWLGGGNVWRLQGCSHSPAPHVTSRPIPRTQSTRLAFSSEFNVHPLFVVAVTTIHDFFAYNIMQHFACFVNIPCFWKVDKAINFNLRMVKQYTQSLNGPDWWTTSSSLASLLPLGLPYHGSTFEHGQFVATTCPHKMSSIIPQQQLHILKHERHQPLYGLSLEQHPSLWSNSITIISQNIKITPVLTKSVDWRADSSDVLGLSQNENLTGS